jgi:protein-disulfide isomerase
MNHATAHNALLEPDPATDHILGAPTARVTILEYGDYCAPACAQAHRAIGILLREYGADIRFVYRHFPEVAMHPHAELAAEAAEAVGAQGRFWPFHDLLFEHQDHLKEKALREYADRVGADLMRYDHEMRDRVYLQRVQEFRLGAQQLGLRALPGFFVDGTLVDVSFGMHLLESAIARARLTKR